jgi:preprotein translocase subunit SecA
LDTFVIPTNVPIKRDDEHDIVYLREDDKFKAVLDDIVESNERGQPVLVGTTSVEKSEIVSRMLKRADIPHETLNAKNHSREGLIVTQAGRLGAVTISTNMAGRGTDIKLGGNAEEMAKNAVNPEEDLAGFEAKFEELKVQCGAEREKVLAAGGLRIVGTERHESRRIDNQLRGRAGRQGDQGSSKFYLSLEDDLLKIFGSDKILSFVERWGNADDEEPIEHRFITRALENAQKKVEGHNFNIRKNLLEYDDVLNAQRQTVYELRRRALMGENIREMMLESIEGVSDDMMDDTCPVGIHPEEWDIGTMRKRLVDLIGEEWSETDDELRDFSHRELRDRLFGQIVERYEAKEEELGEDNARQIERMLLLQFTDQLWKDHLLAMDRLRDGIGLRGYGQRNPLLEYKKEGFNMFMMMNALRDESVVNRILRTQISPEVEGAAEEPSKRAARKLASGAISKPRAAAPAPAPGANVLPRRPAAPSRPAVGMAAKNFAELHGVKRNDPCPCGSGKKFKKCCYTATEEAAGA